MFTGIIQEVGVLRERLPSGNALRLRFEAPKTAVDLREGDSVACDGVCLTAERVFADGFSACAVPETLERTTLCSLQTGGRVNLEPALKAGSPLGGHFVQGHVDGKAEVTAIRDLSAGGRELTVRIPEAFSRYCVEKGSFTLHGASLTIARVEADELRFALIPHTLSNTNLGSLTIGGSLNFEVDLLGKYVEKLLEGSKPGIDTLDLEKWGYAV